MITIYQTLGGQIEKNRLEFKSRTEEIYKYHKKEVKKINKKINIC